MPLNGAELVHRLLESANREVKMQNISSPTTVKFVSHPGMFSIAASQSTEANEAGDLAPIKHLGHAGPQLCSHNGVGQDACQNGYVVNKPGRAQ